MLRFAWGGATADITTCSFAFPSADFKGRLRPVSWTTTATTTRSTRSLGWTGATTGTLTLDASWLIKR